MSYFLSIFAGFIQGVAEFLPISSSGHLVIFHDIFQFNFPDDLAFDVMLHLGTLAALILVFYREIAKVIRGFFSSLFNWNLKNNYNQRLAWIIVVGTMPAAIFGFFLAKAAENYFRSLPLVAAMLIVVALIFFIAEKRSSKHRDLQTLTWGDGLIIGLCQVLAFIPGVSRSGITIVAGLFRQLRREEAARFSFLLSVPAIGGAGAAKIMDLSAFSQIDFLLMVLGFLSSAFFGFLAIKFLLRYLSRYSLRAFAWYRLVIGCLMLIWFFLFAGR